MRCTICLVVAMGIALAPGCAKPSNTTQASGAAPATAEAAKTGSGGATVVTPDVGPVTPVTNSALDNAAGGGVSSSMMKKAKGISANGVGSVNNAQRQGYGADEGSGG